MQLPCWGGLAIERSLVIQGPKVAKPTIGAPGQVPHQFRDLYFGGVGGLAHDPAFFDEFEGAGALAFKVAWGGVAEHEGLAKGVAGGVIGLSSDDIGLEFAAEACKEEFDFIDIELIGWPDEYAIAGVFWAFQDRRDDIDLGFDQWVVEPAHDLVGDGGGYISTGLEDGDVVGHQGDIGGKEEVGA